jgi:hypothetical protein
MKKLKSKSKKIKPLKAKARIETDEVEKPLVPLDLFLLKCSYSRTISCPRGETFEYIELDKYQSESYVETLDPERKRRTYCMISVL